MKNPLLKKNANGFDTPAGPGKHHYTGFYPEAVGGGWNPMTDNNNLSGEISDQMGGYAPGTRGAEKVQGFIDGIYRGTQEPPTKSKEKTPTTGMKFNASKTATGEMSHEECTPENYPLHFAIANAVGGTVEPFDTYQGPYIDTNQGYRLFITNEEGGMAVVWRDLPGDPSEIAESNAFFHDDENGAVEAAISLLPEKPKAKTKTQPWNDKATDRLMKDIFSPKKDKKLRKVPQFSEADKISLHGLGVKGSVKAAWDKALSTGLLQFESNRYSFTKEASAAVRDGLKQTVVQVNGALNRRHIPKSASAHEAAVKVIASRLEQDNRKLDKLSSLGKLAAKATHIVVAADTVHVMRGSTVIDEYMGKNAAEMAESMAVDYGVPDNKVSAEAPKKTGSPSKTSSAKPKCPECGSTSYGLMPTDFETAKCKECGKNWEIGIVPGINDPSEKTASEWAKWAKTAFFSPEDAAKFREQNGGSNVLVNEETDGGAEHDTEEDDRRWDPVKEAAEEKEASWEDGLTNEDCPLPPRERCNTDDADTCCGGGFAYNDKREWVGVPCQCKDCHPPLIGNDHPHAQFIQKKFEQVSSKTASVYKVEKASDGEWYIRGLKDDNDVDGAVALGGGVPENSPDTFIMPGMNYGLSTPEGLTQGIYEQLYDELQTNDNLKEGDIFDTPVGQYIVQGFHVLPHDDKARAALDAVNEQYKCANCGCDQGDHRMVQDGEFTDYMECRHHPKECVEFKKRG